MVAVTLVSFDGSPTGDGAQGSPTLEQLRRVIG